MARGLVTERRGAATRKARRRRGRTRLAAVALAVIAAGLSVWFMAERGVIPTLGSKLHPLRYGDEISRAAADNRLDPYLVAAVVRAESNFDPAAVSHAGAVGLMQLMPDTAEWIVSRSDWEGATEPDLGDPVDNLSLGAYYLAFLLDQFADDRTAALAAYNAGQGQVSAWLKSGGGTAVETLSLADIPFSETRDFVAKVERFIELYRKLYPDAFAAGPHGVRVGTVA